MARRKSRKTKKKKVKRTRVVKTKKEFYNFQRKINRLEQIRRELNSLDTRGFKKEVSIVRGLKSKDKIVKLEDEN